MSISPPVQCRTFFRSNLLDMVIYVLYLFKELPDMEFLLNPVDSLIHCNTTIPILQYNVVNMTSMLTGQPLDIDLEEYYCADHGASPLGVAEPSSCVGHAKGFAIPSEHFGRLSDFALPISRKRKQKWQGQKKDIRETDIGRSP
jgi:hypothetical protein